MPYTYTECKVLDVIHVTEVLRRFFIRFPNEISFSFKAGQFIMLDLPIPSKITNRSYSIASAPSSDNIFELIISIKPDGLGTPYLFNEIKPGSKVKVSKALGKFLLPEKIETDLCFICTGAGIAPFRAMILDIFNRNIPHKNIYLIFGNRTEPDIVYRDEFEKLQKEHPEFIFIPTLSRADERWTGARSYVHAHYEKLFADKHPAVFYLCGWSNMLHEARERIAAMGYEKGVVKFEEYD